jgi:hypothetical protein
VDGTLPAPAAASVARHLEDCLDCRAALVDLRAIRQTAGTLDRHTPSASVWERVSATISSDPPRLEPSSAPAPFAGFERGRQSRLVLAAAALVVLTTIVGLWIRESGNVATPPPASQADANGEAAGLTSAEDDVARAVERDYQQAIMQVEEVTQAQGQALAPDTAATLNQNIAIVDRAIGDARQALESDPQDHELREGLLNAFQSKLELLEQMVLLIDETRLDNRGEPVSQ